MRLYYKNNANILGRVWVQYRPTDSFYKMLKTSDEGVFKSWLASNFPHLNADMFSEYLKATLED